jgi:hypothetical protein
VNYSEFSNVENSGFFYAQRRPSNGLRSRLKDGTRICFSLRSKGVRGDFFRGEPVFEEKSSIFLQKQARPDRFSNGRLLSVAKNSQ